MVAPLFKKNSLEQTGFSINENGFSYRGRAYDFSEITETRSYRVIHQTHLIPMGETVNHNPAFSFALILRDGETIQVTEQSTLLSSSKHEIVTSLQKSYDLICQMTFGQRLEKYLEQIERNGYFDYGVWRLSPTQKKIIDTSSGKAFSIHEMEFLRSYGFIELVPRDEGLLAKTLRKSKKEVTGKSYGISTLSDGDVFFALLANFFQLKW